MSATYESLIKVGEKPRGRRPEGRIPAASAGRVGPRPAADRGLAERVGKALLALRIGNRMERLRAARELGDIALNEGVKLPEAVVPLIVSLKSDVDPAVRQEAAWSLWKLGDGRAHRPLIAALIGDRSARVREKAARSLGLLGVADALPVMIDLMRLGKHTPAKLRAAIASSLGFLADREALPVLIEASDDAEPQVRREAVASLGRYLIGFDARTAEQAASRIMRCLKPARENSPEIRMAAVRALRLSSSEAANIAVAKAAVTDPDPSVREAAAESLVLWDSCHSERALISMLSDDVWQVRKAAARSLSQFSSKYGVHASAEACEALYRITRLFPKSSKEYDLARAALERIGHPVGVALR